MSTVSNFNVNDQLGGLFAAHNIPLAANEYGWLTTRGGFPACRGTAVEVADGARLGLELHIQVAIDANNVVLETFYECGTDTSAALASTMERFAMSTLHVLLAGLWNVDCGDQLVRHSRVLGGSLHKVFIGNPVIQTEEGRMPFTQLDHSNLVIQLLENVELRDGVHWGRLYVASIPGQKRVTEILLDNEPTPYNECLIDDIAFPKSDNFCSMRLFWMLVPESQITAKKGDASFATRMGQLFRRVFSRRE